MPTSPDIRNYFIGKGDVYIKADGESVFRHVGNVPTFEFTPELETLEHESSMAGVKSVDRTVVVSKKGTLKIVMDEWSAANMVIALLGELSQNSEGQNVIEIFSQNAISAEVKLTGTNEVGSRYEWHFLRVDFIPSAAISPITDEFGQLEVDGNVAAVNGSFGTVTQIGFESGVSSESDSV